VSLLKIEQVLEMIPVTSRTIDRWIEAGEFPRPIKIGRTRMWESAEIDVAIGRAPAAKRNDDLI